MTDKTEQLVNMLSELLLIKDWDEESLTLSEELIISLYRNEVRRLRKFELAARALLTECRDKYVTDKWWDDHDRMHDRLSDLLGLPRAYPERWEGYDPKEPVT